MKEDRRKNTRRQSDRILVQTVAILKILEKISRGEIEDPTDYFTDLSVLIDQVGRRQEDRKVVKRLFSSLEAVANNLNKLLEKQRTLRQVKIIKMSGRKTQPIAVNTPIEGWEAERPKMGDCYRVYKDDGGVFSSSPVTEVQPGYIRTQNSFYRLEVLES
jgi:hypothetical protein